MLIKVCGMREKENIEAVLSLEPDYMGFIFFPDSKRYVGEHFSIRRIAFGPTKKIGVFVNESIENIGALIDIHQLDGVQLHGNEKPNYCSLLKQKTKVIKAVSVSNRIDKAFLKTYYNNCDYLLFDTKTALHGGSGQTFNWQLLEDIPQPYFLSGGISNTILKNTILPDNKYLKVLDVNSQYEIAPGLKDLEKLKILFENKKNGNFRNN
jgi:phosphoribosylanthranilate isomerase